MQPGTIVTDIEGHDLGDEGAVVVKVENDKAELVRLDTRETITVQLDKVDYHAEEAIQPEDPGSWGYDESALDSPELHTIRWLPKWWGPRDPNAPSTMTDVMYRPEPYWRRQIHRHYGVDPDAPGDIRMTYHKRPQYRTADTTKQELLDAINEVEIKIEILEEAGDFIGAREEKHVLDDLLDMYREAEQEEQEYRASPKRTAEPLPWMDPVPRPNEPTRQVQRDYGLPRRMRLDRWVEEKDHAFDTEALVAHTVDFWQQYRSKRYSHMSGASSRRSLDLHDWGLMYQDRAGLERNEIELLYRFMAATTLIPHSEYLEFQDVLDTYPVFRYNRIGG